MLPIIWSYAAFQGCAPACTLPRMKSSCAVLRLTPGWVKFAGAAATAGAAAAGRGAGLPVRPLDPRDATACQRISTPAPSPVASVGRATSPRSALVASSGCEGSTRTV